MDHLPSRIFKMIGLLHNRGYESLYLFSGMSPSGCHWRYSIGIIENGKWPSSSLLVKSSIGEEVVEWSESNSNPIKLADDFEAFYKSKLGAAKHPNSQYTLWFSSLREEDAKGVVLAFYADYLAEDKEFLSSAPGYTRYY